MTFPSIEIQGSIISSDLLGKIRGEQAPHQQGKDFVPGFTDARLKDEISLAWQEAKGQWTIFKSKLARLKEGETGTSETRNFWMVPLLTNLGYNLNFNRQSEELNGKSFPIGYRDTHLDNFPIFIGGYNESLDRRPDSKLLRVSPHALMQEYLNHSEYLYGLVTNGRQLRLLRDASRITRLSYVEFNLEKMMDEDLYADFVIFYRLLHASRMPKSMDTGSESILEHYHQDGLAAGSTIRSNLGMAVEKAILNLANGFVNHPENAALRKAIDDGRLDPDEYYRHMLRIIYRLLFLFVIEERNLVYADSKTPETKRFAQIYFNHFSLMRLRKLAGKLQPPEAERHYDSWQGLLNTFALFEKPALGRQLGIMALQGDLFGYHAITCPHYDLHQCRLSNKVLLDVVKSLSYFENENKVGIAVNYGGLDVEEFGSVYEGMLELKLKGDYIPGTEQYRFDWANSGERGKSGSHYTPEELVQPLIKHSLDYLIADRLKEKEPVKRLLDLKVADIACGSGHILLSAARRIAHEVACLNETVASNSREKIEQPSPTFFRKAMKDVIKNCIYGVDKNPLAVELCKIALWLEAYNPGEPLNFLNHHIKCGDAIVGLSHRDELEKGIPNEAFKTLPGDDKEVAALILKVNKKQREQPNQAELDFKKTSKAEMEAVIEKYQLFSNLPERTSEDIALKEKEYCNYETNYHRIRIQQLADAQVAQFFIAKTNENKPSIMTDGDYRGFLRQVNKHIGVLQSNKLALPNAMGKEKQFFHWFIEFPEVLNEGGFDCILGNPPFLGGQKLSGSFGDTFLEYIKYQFAPIGAVDLVTYFFRRIFSIIKLGGFQSLISTNTIAQGKAREDGLDLILQQGGSINFAIKSTRWPGVAAVEVALVTITRQAWKGKYYLGNKEVNTITPYLDDAETLSNPCQLKYNEGKSYQGSIVLGKGFVLEPQEAKALITKDPNNKDVIFPYLNGDDLNNSPNQSHSRWVINFFNAPLGRFESESWLKLSVDQKNRINEDINNEKSVVLAPSWFGGIVASDYTDCIKIIEDFVKPERVKMKGDRGAEYWWQFLRIRSELYKKIQKFERVLVITRVSKYVNITYVPSRTVFMDKVVVLTFEKYLYLSLLQSSIYDYWAWKYSSTLGGGTINFSPNECFETFPFPKNINTQKGQKLENIGEAYHEHRRQLMLGIQLGLTKTYNLFHNNAITAQSINYKDKQVISLQKHLEKTQGTISFDEAIQGIIKLRELHVQMDEAVLDAYGWSQDYIDDDSGEIISGLQLYHNFYEVDYLPENDRIRFTIHPTARKEVLKLLLELNHKIHDEEVKAGLWDKKGKKGKTYLIQEDEEGNRVEEPDSSLGGLFNQ